MMGPASNKGFTLLEFLIAAVILFVALGLAIAAATNMYNSNELAYQVVTATEDAHRAIEQMRDQSTTGTFPSNVVTQFPAGQPIAGFNTLPGEQVIPTYVNTTSDPLSVTITVTWNSVVKTVGVGVGTRVMSRQLSTLLTKR
ncbi:MAG: type II secretion system protein [Candidatus Omnitrophica bacterium]|nr:type II secretion system protein [Candidatus Omnitrophota bacterium]